MLKLMRSYACDLLINLSAQTLIMFFGLIALLCGRFAVICWALVVICFAVILAKMEQSCEKKRGTDFKHYLAFVLLPPNIIALAVACNYFVISATADHLKLNLLYGIIILAGSLAITLISTVYSRVALRQ